MAANNASDLLLTRIDHESKMLNVMRSLFEEGQLTDVLLSCEGQLISAHKLILSSASSYFQSMFQNPLLRNQSNPVIILKDMKLADLKAIIEFVYSGEVRIRGDQLESLVKSAETLDISGLSRIDPNPSNHVSLPEKPNSEEHGNGSSEIGSTAGSINDETRNKASSHHSKDDLTMDENSVANMPSSGFNKNANNSVRDSRSNNDRRNESTGNNRSSNRNSRRNSKPEDLSNTSLEKNNVNNIKTQSTKEESRTSSVSTEKPSEEISQREIRYNFRGKTKESDDQNTSIPSQSGRPAVKERRTSLRETTGNNAAQGKTSVATSNQQQGENPDDVFKEFLLGKKLTNISNKTSMFKKPLEPVVKNVRENKKQTVTSTKSSKQDALEEHHLHHPANESAVTSILKEIVYRKSRLGKFNRDEDTQSVSSMTTRSQRKLLEGKSEESSNEKGSSSTKTTTTGITKGPRLVAKKAVVSQDLNKKELRTPSTSSASASAVTVSSRTRATNSQQPTKSIHAKFIATRQARIDSGKWLSRRAKMLASKSQTGSRMTLSEYKASLMPKQQRGNYSRRYHQREPELRKKNESTINKSKAATTTASVMSQESSKEASKSSSSQQQQAVLADLEKSKTCDAKTDTKPKRKISDQLGEESSSMSSTVATTKGISTSATSVRSLRPKRTKVEDSSTVIEIGDSTDDQTSPNLNNPDSQQL